MQRDVKKTGEYWKYDEDKIEQRTYKRKNKIEKKNKTKTAKILSPKTPKTVKNTSVNTPIAARIAFFLQTSCPKKI